MSSTLVFHYGVPAPIATTATDVDRQPSSSQLLQPSSPHSEADGGVSLLDQFSPVESNPTRPQTPCTEPVIAGPTPSDDGLAAQIPFYRPIFAGIEFPEPPVPMIRLSEMDILQYHSPDVRCAELGMPELKLPEPALLAPAPAELPAHQPPTQQRSSSTSPAAEPVTPSAPSWAISAQEADERARRGREAVAWRPPPGLRPSLYSQLSSAVTDTASSATNLICNSLPRNTEAEQQRRVQKMYELEAIEDGWGDSDDDEPIFVWQNLLDEAVELPSDNNAQQVRGPAGDDNAHRMIDTAHEMAVQAGRMAWNNLTGRR